LNLLRRVLYWQAATWFVCGMAIAAVPHWVLSSLFDQPIYIDYAYVRVAGIESVGMSMLMVLVAQRLEDIYWWAWAFAITTAGLATLAAINALFGLLAGAGSLLWWIFALVNALFTAGLLLGLARAAQEKPIV
jgi:hypothetical protein